MQTTNPFDGNPTKIVDRLIGRSYEVVKTVYLNIPMLREIHDNEYIETIIKNLDTLQSLNKNIDGIANIVNNIDVITELPSWVDKVNAEGKTQVQNIKNTAVNSIGAVNNKELEALAVIQAKADELTLGLQTEAQQAMYSFRYVATTVIPNNSYPISYVYPTSNLKVGDHVVTASGDVYPVTYVSSTIFTLGSKLTTLKGDKGDTGATGTGLELLGVYDTLESFLAGAGQYDGETGNAYQVLDDGTGESAVMIWDINAKTWKNGGALRGIPGESANEILMDPDPRQHFMDVYGQSTGDVIGALTLDATSVVLEEDPVDAFDKALEE